MIVDVVYVPHSFMFSVTLSELPRYIIVLYNKFTLSCAGAAATHASTPSYYFFCRHTYIYISHVKAINADCGGVMYLWPIRLTPAG